MLRFRSLFFSLFLVMSGVAVAGTPDPVARFSAEIQPLMKQFCGKCHSGSEPDGDIDLDKFKDMASIQNHPKIWNNVLRVITERQMPPKNKPQPKQSDREKLIDYLSYVLNNIDDSKIPKDPGRFIIHRLNRLEYNNTVRDLFAIDIKPADNFPADGGGGGGFDNTAETLFVPPILMEKLVEASDEILTAAKPEKIFVSTPEKAGSTQAAAAKLIEYHGPRIWRRPLTSDETTRLLAFYEAAEKRTLKFESAAKQLVKAMLLSSNFLYRIEEEKPTKDAQPIGDYELASRLSYFLWSSMPDEELFNAAKDGKLRDPAARDQQVIRMLKDPKAHTFAENFMTQWFGTRQLTNGDGPDPRRFKEYTPQLREAMVNEPIYFFENLLRENGSILSMLDSDYTFLNEQLAKHYGVPNVTGPEFRQVKLTDANRGGVLGMGSVLALTSYPRRTSPVLRGKWVLEEILGTPPPPPPPQAGVLPQDDAPKDGLTFRQRMEKHREKPECANCHSRMDPIGFGLENFDPTGKWRTEISKTPVDASGVMATGEKFTGPKELRKLLMGRKDEFVRTATEKMLSYALGRGLEYFDQPTVRKTTKALQQNNYSAQKMVLEITNSYPFLHRRGALSEEVVKLADAGTAPAKPKPAAETKDAKKTEPAPAKPEVKDVKKDAPKPEVKKEADAKKPEVKKDEKK